MFDRLSRYFKRVIFVILFVIGYYLLIFVATDTKDVVSSKKEIDACISSGFTVYLDGVELEQEEYENLYALITDYEYKIYENDKIVYFYVEDK